MNTPTGTQTRTISGYVTTLLAYPRWFIDREVDFTNCHLQGQFTADEDRCATCHFGRACSWLNLNRREPTPETPLPDLIDALETAVTYLREDSGVTSDHARRCDCDTCKWLREASTFLRTQRHKT